MGTFIQVAVSLFLNSLSGRVQSERIKEIGDFFEVLSKRVNLIDDILDAFDSVLSKSLVNELIGAKWNLLSVELSEPSFVNEIFDGLSCWVSVGDIWLDSSEHVHYGLVVLNENCVSDSEQSEKREDFSFLWSNLGETFDSYYQEIRAFFLNEELVVQKGISLFLN